MKRHNETDGYWQLAHALLLITIHAVAQQDAWLREKVSQFEFRGYRDLERERERDSDLPLARCITITETIIRFSISLIRLAPSVLSLSLCPYTRDASMLPSWKWVPPLCQHLYSLKADADEETGRPSSGCL